MDNIDIYDMVLLHLDTDLTDTIGRNGGGSLNGDATIQSVTKKWTGALSVAGAGYVSLPDSDDWSFGTGDFTIEFQVNFNVATGNVGVIGQQLDSNNYWAVYMVNGYLDIRFKLGGVILGDYYWAVMPNTGQWYHIEIVRNGTNVYAFTDGISQTMNPSTPIGTNDVGNVAAPLFLGQATVEGNQYNTDGFVDEFRISKGIARHTSNFTPPISPYSFPIPVLGKVAGFAKADIAAVEGVAIADIASVMTATT